MHCFVELTAALQRVTSINLLLVTNNNGYIIVLASCFADSQTRFSDHGKPGCPAVASVSFSEHSLLSIAVRSAGAARLTACCLLTTNDLRQLAHHKTNLLHAHTQ